MKPFSDQVNQLMSCVSKNDGTFEVSKNFMQELPPSLRRRLIKRILHQFTLKDIQAIHIEEIQNVIQNPKPNLTLSLPHQISCIIAYDVVKFSTIPISNRL